MIDNSQTNSGCQICHSLSAQYGIDIRILFNNENLGVAKGNNQGIKMALDDGCLNIILSNNDIEFNDSLLLKNMTEYGQSSGCDAVVPKIYFHDKPRHLWFAGGRFSIVKSSSVHIGYAKEDFGQYNTLKFIDYAPTCFMLLKSSVFSRVGLMDERFFVYYDDTDYMWRMKQCGLKLGYWPQGHIWHKVSSSTGGDNGLFSLYYLSRNNVIFARKHLKLARIVFYAYITLRTLVKFKQYNIAQRRSVTKGLFDGLKFDLD